MPIETKALIIGLLCGSLAPFSIFIYTIIVRKMKRNGQLAQMISMVFAIMGRPNTGPGGAGLTVAALFACTTILPLIYVLDFKNIPKDAQDTCSYAYLAAFAVMSILVLIFIGLGRRRQSIAIRHNAPS